MADGRPMLKPGNPAATHCRHCSEPRVVISDGFLMCKTCDSPMVEGVTIKATWSK